MQLPQTKPCRFSIKTKIHLHGFEEIFRKNINAGTFDKVTPASLTGFLLHSNVRFGVHGRNVIMWNLKRIDTKCTSAKNRHEMCNNFVKNSVWKPDVCLVQMKYSVRDHFCNKGLPLLDEVI